LLIARPSPVPPYFRVVLVSACENDWKRHTTGFDLREVEDIVDDSEQGFAGIADGAGVIALLVVERSVE
jgi:hypothetical protein